MLPNRFEFGNILKLNIEIKGKNETLDEVEFFDGYVRKSFTDFDFKKYFSLSKNEQNKLIIEVLRDVLMRISVENEENKKIAFQILDEIVRLNYEYSFESKLSKYQKSKKHRAIIEIRINNDGQNAFLKIVNKAGSVVFESHLLKNNIYDFYNNLHKSNWQDNTFQILNRDGEIFKQIEIDTEANIT